MLAAAAFDGGLDPAAFHTAPSHEEALARIEWLLDKRQRCGLVVADPGMGKSHLAAAAARRLGGLGAETAVLSLRGLPEGEWLDLLLARLPLDPASRGEVIRPWLKLENRLRENTLMERPTVLVFDDLDHAPADAVDGVARLVAAGEPRFASTCVIATTTPAGIASIPDAIRHRSAVRIDLPPWTIDDVAAHMSGPRLLFPGGRRDAREVRVGRSAHGLSPRPPGGRRSRWRGSGTCRGGDRGARLAGTGSRRRVATRGCGSRGRTGRAIHGQGRAATLGLTLPVRFCLHSRLACHPPQK
jgi:type II secretory pathway predicted ATPase ExeA